MMSRTAPPPPPPPPSPIQTRPRARQPRRIDWRAAPVEQGLPRAPACEADRALLPALCWLALLAAAWVLVLSGAARGATIYVDSRLGDDRYDGQLPDISGQFGGPVRTVQRAVDLAGPGDTITLADRGYPYFGGLTLWGANSSGVARHPFRIEGNGAILSGAKPTPPDEWQLVDSNLWRITPFRKAYYQLVLDGRAVPESTRITDAAGLLSVPVGQWAAYRGAVYYRADLAVHPDSLHLSLADEEVGITLLDVHDVVISNLTLQHFRLDGVNAHDRCRNVLLRNVTCRENGRAGIAVAGTSKVDIVDSKLTGNRAHSLLLTELGEAALDATELDRPATNESRRR